MKRITFIKSSGRIVIGAACGAQILAGCKAITGNSDTPPAPPESFTVTGNRVSVDLDKAHKLKIAGGAVKLEIPSKDLKLIIARTADDEYAILDDRCTHGGRELEYDHDSSQFRCISFGHSRYDINGNVVKGPASSDLNSYKANLQDDILHIDLT